MIDNYPHFTDDPWLDGIIWGCGSKQTRSRVLLKVSELPIKIIDLISEHFENIGYITELIQMPNAKTKQMDLKIEVVSTTESFTELPKYSLRRVLTDHNEAFIDGFILVNLSADMSKTQENIENFNPSDLSIKLHCGYSLDNLCDILDNRQISYKLKYQKTIRINEESYSINPFPLFIDGIRHEFKEFQYEISDRELLIEKMIVKRKGETSADIIDKLHDDLLEKPLGSKELQEKYGKGYLKFLHVLSEKGLPIKREKWEHDVFYYIEYLQKECEICNNLFKINFLNGPKNQIHCDDCIRNLISEIQKEDKNSNQKNKSTRDPARKSTNESRINGGQDMEKKMRFLYEKDTKRKYRFQEVSDDPIVGALYVSKTEFSKQPKELEVTIKIIQ